LCAGKTNIWPFLGVFCRKALTFLTPKLPFSALEQFEAQKNLGPLEMVQYVFCPKKTFCTFRISGTLIVQIVLKMFNVDLADFNKSYSLLSFHLNRWENGKCNSSFLLLDHVPVSLKGV
jgi:hypothetical protein